MKTCNKCHTEKPLSKYYKHATNSDGRAGTCKKCKLKYYKKRNANKPNRPRPPRHCKFCEELFIPHKHYPNQIYCSKICCQYRHKVNCKNCGEERHVREPDATFCSYKCFDEYTDYSHLKEWTTIKECETCGKEYSTGCASSKFCSDSCNPIKWKSSKIYINNCICGEYVVSNNDKKYCSNECELFNDHYQCVKKHLKNNNTCKCIECGKDYYRPYGYKSKKICSDDCRDKNMKRRRSKHRDKRKALKRGAKRTQYINPNKVMKRDKYRCKMCGCKTPRKLRGTYKDNAPEIDHIIPLSKGGNHTYNNIQLLCRKCNADKSDKIIGQAPLMFENNRVTTHGTQKS